MNETQIDVLSLYRSLWRSMLVVLAVLVVTSGVARPWIIVPFFALAIYLMTPHAERLKAAGSRLTLGLFPLVAAIAGSRIISFQGVDELPAMMIEIVSGFLPLSLASHEKPRSFWFAVLNSAVIAVGCVTFTASIVVYLAFMAFILLLLFTLNAANLYMPGTDGTRACNTVPRHYFRQFLHVMPAGVVGAAMIFLTFPRVQSVTMSLGGLGARHQTGYSGMINLSGGGELEESQVLAFMVTSEDLDWLNAAATRLLFRGDALDTFDGKQWKSTIFEFKNSGLMQDHRVAKRHDPTFETITVHMEPTPTTAVFYPDVLADVLATTPGTGELLYNSNGSIIRDTVTVGRHEYTVRIAALDPPGSLPKVPLAELVKELPQERLENPLPYELSERDLPRYLDVPASVAGAEWFQAWVREVGIDPSTDGLATVSARLSRHFQDGFKASLRNQFSSEDALKAFLSSDRTGHCEYFATAAALLFRTLGIPARIVVGYRGGTYNDLVDALEVREENAHAWLEVFVPDVGWYALDPTPSSPPGMTGNMASMLRLYLNAATFFFRQYVIDYDYRTQRDLIRHLRDATKRKNTEPMSFKEWATEGGRTVLIVVLVTALGYAMFRVRAERREGSGLPRFYRVFERRLARRGLRRDEGETFAAFHARALRTPAASVDKQLDAGLVREVDAVLEAELYRGVRLEREERVRLRKAVARL